MVQQTLKRKKTMLNKFNTINNYQEVLLTIFYTFSDSMFIFSSEINHTINNIIDSDVIQY